jgi:hypothetical protein
MVTATGARERSRKSGPFKRRVDEVAQPVRDHVAEALAARMSSGELVEVYQRITAAESLAYIAGRS